MKRRPPYPGYIVFNEMLSQPLVLHRKSCSCWQNVPMAGILLVDPKAVTIFPNRRTARRAVDRTKDYFRSRPDCGRDRTADEYTIRRLVQP